MIARCPQCGTDRASSDPECSACGHLDFGTLLIQSESGPEKIRIRIDTIFTFDLLRRLSPDDARYFSPRQFSIHRDRDRKTWTLRHDPSATNTTCLNGSAVGPIAAPIKDGDFISIGPARGRLRVRIAE